VEAAIAGWASALGSLVSVFVLVDAIVDFRVVRILDVNGLKRLITTSAVIRESFLLLVQLLFLTAVLLSLLTEFRQTVLVLLVAVPIVLALQSIVLFSVKRRLVDEPKNV
jgi:protein-S-isoprenylcysteine O-methyltransferase Ste14